MEKLQSILHRIDHKGYPAYKELRGTYQFADYKLHIVHVQGDPFASPSSLVVEIPGKRAGFPVEYYGEKHRKVALEDFLLRGFRRELDQISFKAKGSGKSGSFDTGHPGQEVLERTACQVNPQDGTVYFRLTAGFPARGRTIMAGELEKMLCDLLVQAVVKAGRYQKTDQKKLEKAIWLADDQKAIREQMKKMELVAFVGNGSILPRESGVSQRPMKDGIAFVSPKSMEVTMELPHKGTYSGMGIPKGITLIVGGGYHGKSTLLQTLEKAVYPHISGDGREYVATDATAVKIRSEDGRSVFREDISLFIGNLPNGKNTKEFSTLDASGSTSQAANTVEAIQSGSKLLLIDEDTCATNFMIRDELMEKVIAAQEEPIVPFIKRVGPLYEENGISTILVAGSCGAFFHVADTVLQMDHYIPKEITQKAKTAAKEYPFQKNISQEEKNLENRREIFLPKAESRNKIKVMGTDGFCLNKSQVDLRYLEQITDSEQMMAIAKALEYVQKQYGGRKVSMEAIIQKVKENLEKNGLSGLVEGKVVPHMAMPRIFEIYGCINRYIKDK